ncbi:MAG: glucose-6-phosphate dehydrogenase [Proteobacteria bacterium]|nr:glucose-6-phosphate dehydrogenase [Pseudomonadota bacterium]
MKEDLKNPHPGLETVVQGLAQASEHASCLVKGPLDPCILVIMGASGDLTTRKLVPALFNLFMNKGLPKPFLVAGCGRTPLDDPAFREHIGAGRDFGDPRAWTEFAAAFHYVQVDYDSEASIRSLADRLAELDARHHTGGNRIFYLATPPSLYQTLADLLGRVGLGAQGRGGRPFTRIVIEKPFSHDLETAVQLNRILARGFEESQIFRIDHYVAKETVQNILVFRFANAIFEPIWDRRFIDYVSITAAETLGVEHRAGYYEQAGVLRDMFQNHMLQLLAMCAMEPPARFEPDRVRDEKVKAFRSLRPFPADRLDDHLVLGQYGSGKMNDRPVQAYREEPGVDPGSIVPTFAMMRVFIDNWRWQGVPFYLTSGKRLPGKLTQIAIRFKRVPHSMFRHVLTETVPANVLTLGIQPEETIRLTFQTKNPGAEVCLRTVRLEFDYLKDYDGPVLDAYEKALLDCMQGDQMLFWRQDGVEACWSFIMPVIEACEQCQDPGRRLRVYPAGTWGPPGAETLLPDTALWRT